MNFAGDRLFARKSLRSSGEQIERISSGGVQIFKFSP